MKIIIQEGKEKLTISVEDNRSCDISNTHYPDIKAECVARAIKGLIEAYGYLCHEAGIDEEQECARDRDYDRPFGGY
jgi:hypothetical protein